MPPSLGSGAFGLVSRRRAALDAALEVAEGERVGRRGAAILREQDVSRPRLVDQQVRVLAGPDRDRRQRLRHDFSESQFAFVAG